MDQRGTEFKYPLAYTRGSAALPNQKIVPKKQEVSA
jgi:hypothetical protein